MTKRNIVFFSIVSILFSCAKDEKYAPKKLSDGTILFSVDQKALTGGTLIDVVQPSLDISSARFSKSSVTSPNYFGGNAVIALSLPKELTNVTVNLVTTSNGLREPRGTFVDGVWTAPLTTLGTGGSTPGNNTTVVLEFIASNSDGSRRTIRFFSITVLP